MQSASHWRFSSAGAHGVAGNQLPTTEDDRIVESVEIRANAAAGDTRIPGIWAIEAAPKPGGIASPIPCI